MLLSLTLLLSSCSALERTIQIEAIPEKKTVIAKAQPPKPLSMNEVKWYVVTNENLEDFKKEIEKVQGELVFYAIIPKTYENMTLNLEEIRRYLLQQKSNITYYENYLYGNEE